MTAPIEITWTDGRPKLVLDDHSTPPGQPTVRQRLMEARATGAIITVGGVPCRVVSAERPVDSTQITFTVTETDPRIYDWTEPKE